MILLQQAAHLLIEPAINQLLAYDNTSSKKLAKLEGKGFGICLTDLNVEIQLRVLQQKLILSSNLEGCDCLVKAKVSQLQSLSDASQITKMIKSDDLELEGDLQIAQGFSNLLMDNEIDWQEILSKYLGDAMAHRVYRTANNLQTLIKRKLIDADYTVASGLTDELRVVPDAVEVEHFIQEVDDLTGNVEKLQAAVEKLKASL